MGKAVFFVVLKFNCFHALLAVRRRCFQHLRPIATSKSKIVAQRDSN